MDQDEYFSVKARLKINAEFLAENTQLPSMDEFINEIPQAFAVASQCNTLDSKTQHDHPEISGMNNNHSALESVLEVQNEKLNLILSYILTQFDDQKQRFFTDSFGASGLSFVSSQPALKDRLIRLKIFLNHPSAAIFCYGQITECEKFDDQYRITVSYRLLQETDRDVLIRAALYYQQKLLRQRAEARHD